MRWWWLRAVGWACVSTLVGGAAVPVAAGAGEAASGAAEGRAAAWSLPRDVAAGGRWAWPVQPPHVVSAYAAPETAYSAGHRGIDLGVSGPVLVTAPDDAVVRFSGVVVDRPVLTLDHGGGVLSSYEPLLSDLPVGTSVARGAVLGAVASGGHCGGSCLHVGVRVDGEYVSPMLFFGRVPPAILLPLGT